MSVSREYLCSGCGRFLLRARGDYAQIEVFFNCPERRCRIANRLDLSQPQQVSDNDRRQWSATRHRWRLQRAVA